MNEITTVFSDSLKGLGRTFLVAHYIPATILVVVHLYILLPMWVGGSSMLVVATQRLFMPTTSSIELEGFVDTLMLPLVASLITLLLLALPVGMVLAILNDLLIRMFEGKLPWLRWGVLYPLTWRNREQAIQRQNGYKPLMDLQAEYRRINGELLQASTAAEQQLYQRTLMGLAEQIDEMFSHLASQYATLILPHETHRIAPTRFGNVYAMAEEYALTRYGVDTVLFWPRLRQLMAKQEPPQLLSDLISQQKTTLDLTINAAVVSGLLALEALISLPFYPPTYLYPLLTVLGLGGVLSVAFYYAAVGAIATLGELIKMSFDYHRQLVLEAFHIPQPDHLLGERDVWRLLARFIMWGDESYLFKAQAVARQYQRTGLPE